LSMPSDPGVESYANFERLDADYQQRILDACIEEFSRNGYESASTNAIVKRAGIPKGSLFYFFGSKKNLYLYIIDHAVKRFAGEFEEISAASYDEEPKDLFERLERRGEIRMQFVVQEPLLYQLFFNAFIDAPEDIRSELQLRYASFYQTSARRLQDGLDRSRFKDDIDVEKAIQLVNLVLEGIFNRYLPALKTMTPADSLRLVEEIGVEVQTYFEMLKKGIYKP
jgi:TetR/AcrR family transcriptional regulator